MFTIFTFPRPFESPFNTPQLNAINSWKKIHKDIEIYLINDELNTAKEFPSKNKIKCIDGKFSKYGSPLLKDAIQSINTMAKNDIILFINTDIIYVDGIKRTTDIVLNNFDKYFIVGRRVDYDIDYEIGSEINIGENILSETNKYLQTKKVNYDLNGENFILLQSRNAGVGIVKESKRLGIKMIFYRRDKNDSNYKYEYINKYSEADTIQLLKV